MKMLKSNQQQSKILILLTLFVLCSLSQVISPESCIQYSDRACTRCDANAHLYNGICYSNILGCIKYQTGDTCAQCEPTSFNLVGNTCVLNSGLAVTADLLAILSRYGLSSANPGDPYGQSAFMPSTLQTVIKWPSFLALNTYIRTGEYSHFISRTSNPIYSVHYYTVLKQNSTRSSTSTSTSTTSSTNSSSSLTYSYKILYYGSGGGLFLCIADVPPDMKVLLRSLTPISSSNIIDYCIDYSTDSRCLRCGDRFHLENKICYPNSGGCIKYRENLCIQCLDFYYLVQNRCVSDCIGVSDARSILYYGNSRSTSTMESYYGVSINQYYSFTIRNTTNTIVTTFNNMSASTTTSSGSTSGGSSSGFNNGAGGGAIIISGSTFSNPSSSSSSSFSGGSSSSSSSSSSSTSSNTVSGSSGSAIGGSTGFDSSSITISPSSGGSLIFNSTNTTRTTISTNPSTTGGSSSGNFNGMFTSTTTTTTTTTTSNGSNVSSGTGISINSVQGISDPNCAAFSNGICTKCGNYYYKNKVSNLCTEVSPFCATYSDDTGQCLTCFPGFNLSNKDCVIAN